MLLFWINCTVLSFPLPSAGSEYTCSATVSSPVVDAKTSTAWVG